MNPPRRIFPHEQLQDDHSESSSCSNCETRSNFGRTPDKNVSTEVSQKRRVRLLVNKHNSTDYEAVCASSPTICTSEGVTMRDECIRMDSVEYLKKRTSSTSSSYSDEKEVQENQFDKNGNIILLHIRRTVKLGMLTIGKTYMTEFELCNELCGNRFDNIFAYDDNQFYLRKVNVPQPDCGTLDVELIRLKASCKMNDDEHIFTEDNNLNLVEHEIEKQAQDKVILLQRRASNEDEHSKETIKIDNGNNRSETGDHNARNCSELGIRVTFLPSASGPFQTKWYLDLVVKKSEVRSDNAFLTVGDSSSTNGPATNVSLDESFKIVAKINLRIQGQSIGKWAGKPLLKKGVHEIDKGYDTVSDTETI